MASLPIFVKIVFFILAFAFGAFCIYGLVGLEQREDCKSKPRNVAVICVYLIVLLAVFGLIPYFFTSHTDEAYQEAVEEAYQDGYDHGYDEGYKFGYEGGYEDGYLEEDYNDDPF